MSKLAFYFRWALAILSCFMLAAWAYWSQFGLVMLYRFSSRDGQLSMLSSCRPSGVPVSILALATKDDDVALRHAAAIGLGAHVHDALGVELLQILITDADPAVRFVAVASLGQATEDERAFFSVVSALRDSDPGVRKEAALVLGDFSFVPSAASKLRSLLRDEDEGVRVAAVCSLWEAGKRLEGADILISSLQSHDPKIRRLSAAVISSIRVRTREITELLEKMRTNDSDPDVRFWSDEALREATLMP